jgi:rod shape determining protein RodA
MFQKRLIPARLRNLILPWRDMDWWLLGLVIGMTILGGVMIRSVELQHGWSDWRRHWITGGVGFVLAMAIARWRYDQLLNWRWIVYGITNISLLAVMFLGTEELGAQRWIPIFGFNVQPSEFAKLGIIITIAALLHERSAASMLSTLKILAITAVPWGLIFLEPNLGTSLVFGAITLGMLYWGNANPGWLLLMLSPVISAILFSVSFPIWLAWVAVLGMIAWLTLPWPRSGALGAMAVNLIAGELGHLLWGILKDYQKERLIGFLNPEKDPMGGGYHLIQSRIAIGAGQFWGRGLHHGTQTQGNFIPEQHTDFIFTAIGEELGFVGAMLVLLAFWFICLRLVLIAQNAKDAFGALITIGVMSMVLFQVTVNIGMTIGLSPVTGIPLPWLSYGNAALLMNWLAIGLVQFVANHRQRHRF